MWEKVLVTANVSLAAMCENFVDIILGSINKTDHTHVTLETDDVSTTIRGKPIHVFDVLQSMALHAAKSGKHISLHATFIYENAREHLHSPCMHKENTPLNIGIRQEADQYAAGKYAIYPLGKESYVDPEILDGDVKATVAASGTKLEGNISGIFARLETIFQELVHTEIDHFVMQVSLSVNSPSHRL